MLYLDLRQKLTHKHVVFILRWEDYNFKSTGARKCLMTHLLNTVLTKDHLLYLVQRKPCFVIC